MTMYAGWTENEQHARERFERQNAEHERITKQREAEKAEEVKQ